MSNKVAMVILLWFLWLYFHLKKTEVTSTIRYPDFPDVVIEN